MVIAALVCLFVAVVALAVGQIFVHNKTLSTLFFVLILLVLVCIGIVSASYGNNFAGYAIFLILSPLPLLLENFQVEVEKKNKKSSPSEAIIAENGEMVENENTHNSQKKKQKTAMDDKTFSELMTLLVQGFGYLLTAICLFFCALHLGKESVFGILFGIALGFVLTFLYMALKKQHSLSVFLKCIFPFVSAGICFGGILCTLLYSFSLTNILFCLGNLVMMFYFAKFIIPKKIPDIVLVAAYLILFVTLLI